MTTKEQPKPTATLSSAGAKLIVRQAVPVPAKIQAAIAAAIRAGRESNQGKK